MKIKAIEIGETEIPLKTPFKTALRTVSSINDIVVRIVTEDGETGYGEAAPTAVITGETKGSICEAIQSFIAPSIVGCEIEEMALLQERLHKSIVKNTSAKAAVDIALFDLYAKSLDKPLYQALGGCKKKLETDITISVNPVEQMVSDSLSAIQQGFRILKVKVGKEGLQDIERLLAIRKAVGEEIAIRVDANQGWTPKEAVRIIRLLEDKGLNAELVEQPVAAYDRNGLKFVTQNVLTPILADESVFSARDAVEIIQEQAADFINIKLMKTAGIFEALKICSIAETYQVPCMMGCMLESKLSVSAAAHLAAAKGIITMIDLDGPSLSLADPYEGGPEYRDPHIEMNNTPGLGIREVPGFDPI